MKTYVLASLLGVSFSLTAFAVISLGWVYLFNSIITIIK